MSRMDDSELDSEMSDHKGMGVSAKEKKAMKKLEKKKKSEIQQSLLMLPFMMYAGTGRH